jgi:signal transduction histidine kinase/ActR/RegA family two-component response regulator
MGELLARLETLQEDFAATQRLLAEERARRASAELLARGLASMTAAVSHDELLRLISNLFCDGLDADEALLMGGPAGGLLRVIGQSSPAFAGFTWPWDPFTARVLDGRPSLVLRTDRHPGWQAQPEAVRGVVGSALHVRVSGHDPAVMLIAVHRDRGHFSRLHVDRIALIARPLEEARQRAVAADRDSRLRREAEEANQRLRDTQRALLAARDAAEERSRTKSAFLATMSHELRTPLGAIIGLTELALAEPLPADATRFVDTARQSAEHLLMVLNDILDLSKIEAGQMTLERIPLDLVQLIEEVRLVTEVGAREKMLTVSAQLELASATHVRLGDPLRLKQILLNLLSNAVKFTAAGTVSLRAHALGGDTIRFDVLDTGSGVPEERKADIFEPFRQGDESTSRRFGGTGLGLAICRQLVALSGGSIWVEDRVGGGSCFSFTVELPPVVGARASRVLQAAAVANSGPLRVLVAEDHPVNQLIVRRMLERLGHVVSVVRDGRQALEAHATQPFDVILMDIQMPEMDGFEATERIRQTSQVPIIALTANAMSTDRDRCLRAGMAGYLTKPVRQTKLSAALIEVTYTLDFNRGH